MLTADETKRIARRYPEEVATTEDIDKMDELVSADVVEHGPMGQQIRGVDALKEHMEAFLESFEDFEASVQDVFAEDDMVSMRVRLRGRHTGEFMGFEGTGKSFEVDNLVITRVEDGKIAERWLQPDLVGMLHQLELLELADP